jgi:hypothetical protein
MKTYLDLLPDDVLQMIWIKVNANVLEELKNKHIPNPYKGVYAGIIRSLNNHDFIICRLKSYNRPRYNCYEDFLLSKQKDKNTITGLFGFAFGGRYENEILHSGDYQEYLSTERKSNIKKNKYYSDALKENNIKVKSNMKKLDMIKMLIKL